MKFMEIVALLLIWFISPIVLLIISISQASKASKFQKLYKQVSDENIRLKAELKKHTDGQTKTDAETEKENAPPETAEKTEAAVTKPEPAVHASSYDMSYKPSTAGAPKPKAVTPEPVKTAEPAPVKKAENTSPKPEKHKVSSINVLFIIGALFIITAGLIFATTTWEFLSSGIRAVVILSLSALFFAASSLAERKFSLQKTGMLFYTLGSVFLPITLIAAGYFKVFGEWFSLTGEGRPLLLAITFAALSAVTLKGGCDYRSKPFSWCGLISFSAFVSCLILQFTDDTAMFALVASIYSFAMLFICAALSKITSEKLEPVISQLNIFAAANTIILSISSLASAFTDGNDALAFASCAIFAAGYLKSSFTQKNGFAGAIPFTLFATCGVFAVSTADDFGGYMTTLVFASAIPAVLSFMNFFPEKLKSAVTIVSSIFSVVTAVLCAVASFAAEPSVIMLAAYAVLAAEVLALYLLHKNEKSGQAMLSVFPVPCMMLIILGSRLIFNGMTDNGTLTYTILTIIALTAVLQALFVMIKPLKLRTTASDYIISCSAAIAGFALVISEYTHIGAAGEILCLTGILAASGIALMPVIGLVENRRLPFIGGSLLCSGLAVFPLYELFADLTEISDDYDIAVPCLIMASVYAVISVLVTLFCRHEHTDTTVTIVTRTITGLFVFAVFFAEEILFPLFIILTAAVLFRGAKRNDSPEFGAGIVLFIMTVLTASIDIFDVEFQESWLFACGAAAVVYLAALFMPNGKLVKTADTVSRYAMLGLTCLCMLYITGLYEWNAVYIVMTALFFLLTVTSFYNAKYTPPLAAPFLILYPIIEPAVDLYLRHIDMWDLVKGDSISMTDDYSISAIIIAAVMLVSVIPSYLLHSRRLREKDGPAVSVDIFAFSRFIGFCCYTSCADGDIQSWCGIILLAVCILSLIRKEQTHNLKKLICTAAAFMPVLAWISQPFFEVPEIISLEFNIVPFLLYCFALRFMWKNGLPFIDNLTFVVYIVSFLALFLDAMSGEYVADGLIIVISALAMLIFSFMVKKKKWFILGVTVIVVATLFMSRNFWASLAWWVYLLAAGLLLIAIAAANELKKQAAVKNEKSEFEQKLTRFMSEWTW